jgi:hypothetical protein
VRFLLILAFVLGQMSALAHVTRHELVAQEHRPCEICTFAHAAPVPPAPLLLLAVIVPQPVPESLPSFLPGDRRPFERPNTRGPPSILA